MAISEQDLSGIETLLAADQGVAEFRRRFPGLSLTRCDASDMSGQAPFRRHPKFDLYLVDGRDHCWQITPDPARATGVVVAAQHKETA